MMKRRISIFLTILLCIGTFCSQAETVAGQEMGTASLELSSFDGGPEYELTIDDPQIVSYTYDDLNVTISPVKKEWIVGTDVAFEDITDFYYTYDASTGPPRYQRYRFFMENGETMFYHETREGGGWPQTEEDITVSGTMQLSEEEREMFCSCVKGGIVREREESLDDGDAGPWMFLYWNGDHGIYQEFSFASWEKKADFEVLCETLRDSDLMKDM